jgi:MSHA biogenesis protein MshQ
MEGSAPLGGPSLARRWMQAALRAALPCLLALAFSPALAVPGLTGVYYNNTSLSGTPLVSRVDGSIDFDWGSGVPNAAVPADNFSVRWSGKLRVPSTGNYTFRTTSDDGVRLYINGALVINNWTAHAATNNFSSAITLSTGVDHTVVLEYYEQGGLARIQLAWLRPGDSTYATVPPDNGSQGLFTNALLMAEYLFEEASYNGSSGEVKDTGGLALHGNRAALTAATWPNSSASPAVAGASTGTCRYGVFDRSAKQYAALPSGFPSLLSHGSFTVTAWIRTTDRSQSGQRIFIQDEQGYGSTTNGYIFSLGDRGPGMLNFHTRATGGSDEVVSGAVISDNTWYFTAFGVDAAAKRKFVLVYDVSGALLSSVSTTYTASSLGTATGVTSIGGETNAAVSEATSSFGFAGNLDEVRAYSGAMSAQEINAVRLLTHACTGMVAAYRFEDGSYNGSTGELKDYAGHASGPYHGRARGNTLPTAVTTSPARPGTNGTCGYAQMPGPNSNGGYFTVTGLPVNVTAAAQNTVSFWMYWNGTDDTSPISFNTYNLWLRSGYIGFNTGGNDLYATSSSGLANGWHHIVAVFTNGGNAGNALYIDGVQRSLSQVVSGVSASGAVATSTLHLGTWGGSLGGSALIGRLDEVRVFNQAVTSAEVASLYAETHACSSLHHLEIRHGSGTALTCTPAALTLVACQDAACTTPYTAGLSGTLTSAGPATANWPSGAAFTIAAGSSSTTLNVQVTTAGTTVLGASGLAPSAASATTCNFGSPACTFTASDTGLMFDVSDHVADTAQTVYVTAVKKSDTSQACTAGLASVTRNVTFRCSYANPTSGSWAVRVGGSALNSANSSTAACDAGGRAISLVFNAAGEASTTVQYADVGRMSLTGSFTGSGSESGLVLTGSDTFIAAPATFAITGAPGTPIAAGNPFSATVVARNSSGQTTPNFGRETVPEGVALSLTRRAPTGSGASDGAFSGTLGSFSSGLATSSTLTWSEVGQADLVATLQSGSYLGSGFTASGSTGSSGALRFVPHHFDTSVTPACGPAFSYSGQPFSLVLRARNAAGATTVNYDGTVATSPNMARVVGLSAASAIAAGSWSSSTLAASAFTAGVANASVGYAFTSKLSAPATLTVRATDSDGVSSSGYTEGSTLLRSGRLQLSNAYGSERTTLRMAARAQYWSGSAWATNSDDACTLVPASAVAQSNKLDHRGAATTAWSTTASALQITAGQGWLDLTAPSPSATGSVDIALNLGSSGVDQSCLASHPATTPAALPWLRAQNGSCSSAWDRDPAARASFGIASPETRRTVHVRELF